MKKERPMILSQGFIVQQRCQGFPIMEIRNLLENTWHR